MTQRSDGGIRCAEVLANLSDYIDGDLDSDTVNRIEAHLSSCTNCEQFGHNFGRMVVSLKSMKEPDDVDESLLARIGRAIDQTG
ncbi:MAG: zf-HC2 domain-containing protein [Myxococcota bacterium]